MNTDKVLYVDIRSRVMAFAMGKLRTLVVDFEATEDRRDNLECIVNWAATCWKFLVLTTPLPHRIRLGGETVCWCPNSDGIPGKTSNMYRIQSGEPGVMCPGGKPGARSWLTTRATQCAR